MLVCKRNGCICRKKNRILSHDFVRVPFLKPEIQSINEQLNFVSSFVWPTNWIGNWLWLNCTNIFNQFGLILSSKQGCAWMCVQHRDQSYKLYRFASLMYFSYIKWIFYSSSKRCFFRTYCQSKIFFTIVKVSISLRVYTQSHTVYTLREKRQTDICTLVKTMHSR